MFVLLVFLALGSVSTHDIIVGSSTGDKKVFDEHFQASPAVWRQTQNVTINTTDDEVISRIVVTDLREEKDGDAKIVDGGQGQKKVTIELKSPTVLRGYDFNVEVYAEPNKEFQANPLTKNIPPHLSEFKTNAGNLNTHNPGSKVTLTNFDVTTKSPEIPKIQTSSQTPKNARETRDVEIKKPEENKPKIAPSIFGHQNKVSTTVKPTDSNAPATANSRLFGEEDEDEEKSTETVLGKDNKNKDEARHIGGTHEDTNKNAPKSGSIDTKTATTSTTFKTPSYNNVNRINLSTGHPVSVADDRETRATHKEYENASPTLVPSQKNPSVYTPNLGYVPSIIKDAQINNNKPIKDEKRDARDTHDEAKTTPKVLADGLTNIETNQNTENGTKDEERNTRSAQTVPKITPINIDVEEVTSTTAQTFINKDKELKNGNTDKQTLNPPVLTRTQNYPLPYPYETTPKIATTTKSPQKRDTPLDSVDKKSVNPKLFAGQNATSHHNSPIVSLQ
ncbi:uncharacterized protein LOC128680817 [Plodia interpunctella]|uniref:uncharacterized protein LOC128680817 n=1 Tax=Plodia interpunctella TaxID=58824 RepID=UPI0023677B9E|nr:uncharacterized protein LOC128680817 [Plodia interpunctella]